MLAGVVTAVAVAAPAVPATGPGKKVVKIFDNYYLPLSLKVARGTTIVWKWPADVGDVHDVKLGRHPKGAKPFWSEPGASGYSFSRKLTVPGTYKIVCTLHEEMTMTITVKKS